jgi:hypothetical protein
MLRHLKLAWAPPLWAVALVGALHGCGGGGQTASNNTGGVGSGGTGSYTNGPISGLGSIIVNGVRYDVDGATLLSEDKDTGNPPSTDDLLVGVTVEVEGSGVTPVADAPGKAVATRVRYAAELIGALGSLSLASGRPTSFTVLGQHVTVNASTVLPDTALSDGQVVVVHGLPTPGGGVTATRVDAVLAPSFYKLSGEVQSINRSTRIVIFRPGTVQVRYALSLAPPAGIAAGSLLRVRVQPSNDLLNLQAVRLSAREDAAPGDREVRLEGRLSGYSVTGTTVRAYLGTTLVDLSAIPGAATLSNQTGLLGVKGRFQNGVLVATELEEEDEARTREAELYGAPSLHNPGNKTFTLRGLTIDYRTAAVDANVAFNEPCLKVKGEAVSASQVRAASVKRDNDCR